MDSAVAPDPTLDVVEIPVIATAKVNTRWHLHLYRVVRDPAKRSGVILGEPQKISSASSLVQALDAIASASARLGAVSVSVDPSDSDRWLVTCADHQIVARNTTMEYAVESAYWHTIKNHPHQA